MSVAELTQDEQEFEAAFEGRIKKPEPQKATEAEPSGGNEAGGQPEDGGEPQSSQQPEGEAGQGGEKPQAGEDTVESLRAKLNELAHQERSSAGRVSVFMRKAEQAEARVAELEREVAELKGKLAQAKPAKSNEASSSGNTDDVLDNAPELKAAVESRIQKAVEEATSALREQLGAANEKLAEVGQKADQAAQRVEPLASREEQREMELVRGRLDKLFPNWRADVASGEVQEWLKGQHESIRSLFPGTGFDDSSTVLKLFYADKGAAKPPTGGGAEGNDDRLRKAAGIQPRPAARVAPDMNDFEGSFAEFSAKRQR